MKMVSNMLHSIVYGQQYVGKTSFILKYLNLPVEHQNTPCKESFVKTEILNNEIICLSINKISKKEDLTSEEVLKSDICILSFSVNDPMSFAYIIQGKTIICKYKPDMPLIIVATKSDLRNSTLIEYPCIDISRVHSFASEIGAYAYFETSIFLQDESSLIFRQAIKIVKLVSSYNNNIELQLDFSFQRIFSTFKNIWKKTNNMFKEQTTVITENKNIQNNNNTSDVEKCNVDELSIEEENNDKMNLLSTLSATGLESINIDDSKNSREKGTFV